MNILKLKRIILQCAAIAEDDEGMVTPFVLR